MATLKLVTSACLLFLYIESAVGVQCYVGSGFNRRVMTCPGSSSKCVWSRAASVIGYVCYDQMKWSAFPAFTPRMGCQGSTVGGNQYKICICSGDRCNRNEVTASRTRILPEVSTPKLSSITAISVDMSTGVQCYVGASSSKMLMNCGGSSEKCVWSKAGDITGYVCYNQMKWSMFPSFDPRLGCQGSWSGGQQYKICVCKGDRCNENEESAVAGGSRRLHALSLTTLLLTAVGACLWQ